jgi:hypothetical protein
VTGHAIYAPSSAHRWIPCTASASAIAAIGEQEEGEEAAEGTRAHDEIERILGPLCSTRSDVYPQSEPIDPDHPAAYGIALVVDFVRQLLMATPGDGRLWIEQRVELTKDIWGRCDVAHWDPVGRVLTIVDYKNGFVNVEAERNEQLQIYAAGSIFTHNLPAEWIRLVVVQPNSFLPVPRVKQWVTSADALYAFAQRVAAIPAGPLQFKAGEQCTYCPLFGRCPASKDALIHLGAVLAHAPDEVPAGHVALFKALEKPIADWFKGLDKSALKKALAGKAPPGMKVVAIQKHRAWKDVDAARALVIEKIGVAALEPPTPAQAEKLGLDISGLTDTPEGGPALAFESDRRPAFVQKSVTDMFRAAVEQVRREDAA